MKDRELLELAAKAAGIDLQFKTLMWTTGEEYPCYLDTDSVSVSGNRDVVIKWNPLESDADALRLAVKVLNWPHGGRAFDDAVTTMYVVGQLPKDPYAATRRAIVRAAAEIGKAMEDK